MDECLREIVLANGLTVQVYDSTRRYYEDYHLVRLEFVCEAPVMPAYFDDAEKYSEARALLGDTAVYRRMVEKMGVPYVEIGGARERLIKGFESNALGYFSNDAFPCRLVLSELEKARERAGKLGR